LLIRALIKEALSFRTRVCSDTKNGTLLFSKLLGKANSHH